MKKYLIIAFAACLALFSSCNKDLLDVPNENSLSTGLFWKSEADINQGLIAVYGMFYRQGTWTRNIHTCLNGMADDGTSYSAWIELAEWTRFVYTNYNFDEQNGKIWQEHWTAVNRANQVLDNIDNVEFASESDKNDLKAQALWLRSFYYYYMVAMWENIPLLLHTSSSADQPANSNPDEIYTQLENDLKQCIEWLPTRRDALNTARPTKGAAYALLAKIYMQHHKYAEAITCFEWLVDGDGKNYYDLVANYGDNFSNYTENNKESIYEIHFSLINTVGFDQTMNYLDPNAQLGTQLEMQQGPPNIGWNNMEARRWLVDYFKREKTTSGTNDERLYYTLWYDNASSDFPDAHYQHLVYGKPWEAEWGQRCFPRKYSTDVVPIYYWNDNNYRVIRLADILLLYAEALNEVNNGPTAKAIECVDRVRSRAQLSKLAESSYYTDPAILSSKAAFFEHIKIERALELAHECVRWIDLQRWGLDEAAVAGIKTRDEDFNNFKVGKHHRMPLFQADVDNNPNLIQNSGY